MVWRLLPRFESYFTPAVEVLYRISKASIRGVTVPRIYSRGGLTRRPVTYQGDPTRSGSSVLKALVVITIVLVAYWASTGGFDSIVVPGTIPVVTSTVAESSTIATLETTTTTLGPTTTSAPASGTTTVSG